MKYILATLLSTTSALLHAGNTSPFITHPEITLGVTQSTEQLDWNIAGPTINILSELKWKHTSTLQPRLRVAVTAHSDFHLAAAYSQGKLGHGTNQDTDYNDNDRKSPILQSINQSGGKTSDLLLLVGRNFDGQRGLTFTPMLGWNSHQQHLTATEGFQTLPAEAPYYGPFAGLNNLYDARWQGPLLSLAAKLPLRNKQALSTNISYQWASYYATADWNLRQQFAHPISFEHRAQGHVIAIGASWLFQLSDSYQLNLNTAYHQLNTQAGIENTFLRNGDIETLPLNAAHWTSHQFSIELSRQF